MTTTLTAHPVSLTVSPRVEERLRLGQLTQHQVDDFRDFLKVVDRDFLHHRIILTNPYTRWFQKGQFAYLIYLQQSPC